MTKKDDSPKAGEDPYWSKELLAVLVVALRDEDHARETLQGIIRQAQEGSQVKRAHAPLKGAEKRQARRKKKTSFRKAK